MTSKRLIYFCALLLLLGPPSIAQSLKERKAARLAESEKPRMIPGGISFQVKLPANKAFDAVLAFFHNNDIAIDESSNRELGQLVTALHIVDVGGFLNNNKGYRTYITFMRETDFTTTIKVKVAVQVRTKHLRTEPWGDPQILDADTAALADELKKLLPVVITAH